MDENSSRQPTLEITGIALAYAAAGGVVLLLASGLFGLPGVDWAKVLPVPVRLAAVCGMAIGFGLLYLAYSLFRLEPGARMAVVVLQGLFGVLLPLAFNPTKFLPRVDWEFIALARGFVVALSAGILAYLLSRRTEQIFADRGLRMEDRFFYCPLCQDRFDDPPARCPACEVPILHAVRTEEGETFACSVETGTP